MSRNERQQTQTDIEWELFALYHRAAHTVSFGGPLGVAGSRGDMRTHVYDADTVRIHDEEEVWTAAATLTDLWHGSRAPIPRGTCAVSLPANDDNKRKKQKKKKNANAVHLPAAPPTQLPQLPLHGAAPADSCPAPIDRGGVGDRVPQVRTGRADGRLVVSTKTQSLRLNVSSLPLEELFWGVPLIPYMHLREGVVKKEMRVEMKSEAEVERYEAAKAAHAAAAPHVMVRENIYRRKFLRGALRADIRRINLGVCQKELQCKKRASKMAFSNCFVLYLRWTTTGGMRFEESHVKVFSTGQIDLPGITDPRTLEHVEVLLHGVLRAALPSLPPLTWSPAQHAVLINSDFLCNFQLEREALRTLLLVQHGIKSMAIAEQPGLRCSLFVHRDALHDPRASLLLEEEDELLIHTAKGKRGKQVIKHLLSEKYFKITATFFRTGKVLVSGACTEAALNYAFERVRDILLSAGPSIYAQNESLSVKKAKKTHYVSKSKHAMDAVYFVERVVAGPHPAVRENEGVF